MGGTKRILIIALPRSGSTNLMKSVAEFFKLKIVEEPWNPKVNNEVYDNLTFINQEYDGGIVLKTLVNQRPIIENTIKGHYRDFTLYDKLIPTYDLVILLSRKNKMDMYESFQHFCNEDVGWHTEWVKNESMEISETTYRIINNSYDTLGEIGVRYDIPITWYEDLYSGDYELFKEVTKDWGVDTEVFFDYFNPNNRLRKN